jgi:hypothetical protein
MEKGIALEFRRRYPNMLKNINVFVKGENFNLDRYYHIEIGKLGF